jgi:hypothetical protein
LRRAINGALWISAARLAVLINQESLAKDHRHRPIGHRMTAIFEVRLPCLMSLITALFSAESSIADMRAP